MKICVFHADCLDGLGAAAVVKMKYPDVVLYDMKYGDKLDFATIISSKKLDDLYVVDFSFSQEQITALCELFNVVTIIDHHKTYEPTHVSWHHKPVNFISVYDPNMSGATLTYLTLFDEHIPKRFLYVEDRDLWKWQVPNSAEFTTAAYDLYLAEGRDAIIDKLSKDDIFFEEHMITVGSILERAKQNSIKQLKENVSIGTFYGANRTYGRTLKVGILNSPIYMSELGNVICSTLDVDMAIVWYNKDGMYKISARSVGDFNVLPCIEELGGGGHPRAAGASITQNPIEYFNS